MAGLLVAALGGCGTADKTTMQADGSGPEVPKWVVKPKVEGGIAATECVPQTGQFTLDKAEAVALARANLAKQIRVKVKAMDKTYRHRVRAQAGTATGGVFESVSRQVTEEYLQGSEMMKLQRVDIGTDKTNLCAMVGINKKRTKGLFLDLLKVSGKQLDPRSKEVLYEEFRAKEAQRELDRELAGD